MVIRSWQTAQAAAIPHSGTGSSTKVLSLALRCRLDRYRTFTICTWLLYWLPLNLNSDKVVVQVNLVWKGCLLLDVLSIIGYLLF